MSTKITEYKCPSCTGPLRMNPSTQKLVCDYCDSTYSIDEIEALYKTTAEPINHWDVSGLNKTWSPVSESLHVYNCPSCGADLICDATEASLTCPYCGNAAVMSGQFEGDLKPDYIIPFKLDADAAKKALLEYYHKKPLLPRMFRSENTLNKIRGVYVPFWFFDGAVKGSIQFECTDRTSYREGDYDVTKTKIYEVSRGGKIPFDKIPVDASSKMPDDLMDSVEPFDYSELVPFSEAYLPGFMASRYDVTPQGSFARAEKRIKETAEEILSRDVTGFDTRKVKSRDLNVLRGKVHYALLPVYLLYTQWNGNDYLFAMNGQTGKFIGNLPIDKPKKICVLIAAALLPAAIVAILRLLF